MSYVDAMIEARHAMSGIETTSGAGLLSTRSELTTQLETRTQHSTPSGAPLGAVANRLRVLSVAPTPEL